MAALPRYIWFKKERCNFIEVFAVDCKVFPGSVSVYDARQTGRDEWTRRARKLFVSKEAGNMVQNEVVSFVCGV